MVCGYHLDNIEKKKKKKKKVIPLMVVCQMGKLRNYKLFN